MIRGADAIVLYHTIPHVDVFETGQRGAALLRKILVDGVQPVTALQKVPCVFPAERANTELDRNVSWELKNRLIAIESMPSVLTAGIATVQPWLDIPELGSTVLVVTGGNAELAAEHTSELARTLWQRREEYLPELVPVDLAVRMAHRGTNGAHRARRRRRCDHLWRARRQYVDPGRAVEVPVARSRAGDAGVAGNRPRGRAAGRRRQDRRERRRCPRQQVQPAAAGARRCRAAVRRPIHDLRPPGPQPGDRHGTLGRVANRRCATGGYVAFGTALRAGIVPRGWHRSLCSSRASRQEPLRFSRGVSKSGSEDSARRLARLHPSDFWKYDYHHIPRPLWPWDRCDGWAPAPKLLGRQL